MLDSASVILNSYISEVSPYAFYSIEMERGENPEDLYYLCTIEDRRYIVFETDYFDSLSWVAQEAADIFKQYDVTPLHWLVKKDHQSSAGTAVVPIDTPDPDTLRESLVLKKERSFLLHAVIECADTKHHEYRRYDPNAYGFSTA